MRIFIFIIGYCLCHLDAFAVMGVPMPWLGLVMCMVAGMSNRIMPFPILTYSFASLVITLCIVTIINGSNIVPNGYILFRLLNMIGFAIVVNFVTLSSSSRQGAEALEGHVLHIGLVVAVIAIIIFLMHRFGLGDLPRNRMGTGGFEQAIIFTFETGEESNRALGTFREPSFLALSLILPASIAVKNKKWASVVVMLLALYLTYSLGTMIALAAGIVLTMLVFLGAPNLLRGGVIICMLGALVAGVEAMGWIADSPLRKRLDLLSSFNLLETSRGYVYENLYLVSDSLIAGGGIGRFAFSLGQLMGSQYPISSLNLFLTILSSGGVIALCLIIVWFVLPNVMMRRLRSYVSTRHALLILLPLNVFGVLYTSTFEELHVWHAVALGLCLGRISQASAVIARRRAASYR